MRLFNGDYTPLEHAAITAVLQFVLTVTALFSGHFDAWSVVMAALLGPALFYMRELTQKEASLKKEYGADTITWAITWEAMNPRGWKLDSKLDFWLPVAVAVIQCAGWLWWGQAGGSPS